VYKDDQERVLSHYTRGEDPNDPDVFLNDIKKIFDDTKEMIKNIAQEQGFNIDNVDDVEAPAFDPDVYVLYRLAKQYSKDAHAFMQLLAHDGIPQELNDAYDDLMWYHTLIVAKTGRLVSSFADGLRDEELQRREEEGTVGVINKCIRVSDDALQCMLNELPEYLQTIADLKDMLQRIDRQIKHDIRQKVGT